MVSPNTGGPHSFYVGVARDSSIAIEILPRLFSLEDGALLGSRQLDMGDSG